jgi:nucleolar protein 56
VKALIIETVIGFFAFDEKGEVIDKELFVNRAESIVDALEKVGKGLLVQELSSLISRIALNGYDTFDFEGKSLADAVQRDLGFGVEVVGPTDTGKRLRADLPKVATELGYVDDEAALRELSRRVSTSISRVAVKEAAHKRDLLLIQAIHAIDELDGSLNIFSTRVREWYGYHFPELNNLIEKHDTYLRLVNMLGARQNLTLDNLKNMEIPESRSRAIADVVSSSMGADFDENDLETIRDLSASILELYKARRKLDGYVERLIGEVAPNLKMLAGSSLGARLVSLAGGLDNLSRMPASTIQILGAEKALFRSMKTGALPPKHGAIFQHQDIHQALRWQRGKIARALSGKIAIAARVDAFKGEFMGEKLKMELDNRVREIKTKYPRPPVREKVVERRAERRTPNGHRGKGRRSRG